MRQNTNRGKKSWMADKVEQWPIDKLIPYARNARKHSAEQVAQIAASIAEFGFTNPILAGGDGVIVAGHGRLAAAQKLGLEFVPVLILDHLDANQRRALVIADNRIAESSEWDDEMLRLELLELNAEDYGLGVIGFTDSELDTLIGDPDEEEDEPAPDVGIDYQEKYAVLVECDDEAHQEVVFNQVAGLGLKCKVLVN